MNFEGGFDCQCGKGGFTTSDYRNCTCPSGTMWAIAANLSRYCQDIDECKENDKLCSEYYEGSCSNLDHGEGYECVCAKGYVGDIDNCTKITCPEGRVWKDRICADIDECVESPGICDEYENTTCENNDGSYYCSCGDNFVIEKSGSCSCKPDYDFIDIDPPVCTKYTQVLLMKKMDADLVDFNDGTMTKTKMDYGENTGSHWSCSVLHRNELYLYGGVWEQQQISKVYSIILSLTPNDKNLG